MFEIVKKQNLAKDIILMDVKAPRVAKTAQPGQFVIVRIDEHGERIPLTICDYSPTKGTITIVTQIVGASSRKIANMNQGDHFLSFVGPLGHPSELIHYTKEELQQKNILLIAGGLGTAPVYPQVKWLHEQGASPDVMIGTKTKDLIILENETRKIAKNLYLATDDGSKGFKGLVTELLKDLIDHQHKHYDLIIAIGPMIMMKYIALTTKPYQIKTIVSLNTLMVDGTGMCGACRVSINNQTKFTCVDGPEFDAHTVNFDEALRRQSMYKNLEKKADCECLKNLNA
ncbi:MAG: sulfide/dihydroorotate dehydrogenase-like FAD/NAD-binding protein [Bacteroidales bacterium]